jgi:hypothetical protein
LIAALLTALGIGATAGTVATSSIKDWLQQRLKDKEAAEEAATIRVERPKVDVQDAEVQTDKDKSEIRWKCRFCGDEHPDHPGAKCPSKKHDSCNFCGEKNPDHPGRNCPSRSGEINRLEADLVTAYENIDSLEAARNATWLSSTQEVWVSEHGERFHQSRQCRGLRNANRSLCKTRCRLCG